MARTTALAERPETPAQAGDLIALAIEKGMDADALTKLVDLVERRERAQAEREYTDAIRSVSDNAGVIIKSKSGSKAKYAPLDEVNRILTPLYTAAGLALSFSETDCPFVGGTKDAPVPWKRHVCDVRHTSGHKERYHVDLPLDNANGFNPGMNPIQSAISTGSYAQRVLLCRVFNLTIALTDVDGDSMADLIALDAEQRQELNGFIAQERMDEAKVGKLLKWVGAESLDAITQSQFRKISTTYRQRKGAAS